jgi:hypothetical protein
VSQWGVFFDTDHAGRHVISCDADGHALAPHVVDTRCICKPVLDDGVWVHQDDDSQSDAGVDR